MNMLRVKQEGNSPCGDESEEGKEESCCVDAHARENNVISQTLTHVAIHQSSNATVGRRYQLKSWED